MISAIIPVYNEQYNVTPLLEELQAVSARIPLTEIIMVDDASNDGTYDTLLFLRARFPALRVLKHSARAGQSAALWTGIQAARQPVIVTLDGDGQNNPDDITLLYERFQKLGGMQNPVMVAGQREKRHDHLIRKISSRTANGVRSFLLRDQTRDTGCSLKMFRRQDYLTLPYFNHMHRFLPALMMRERVLIDHVNVSHRPRERGVSKYGTLERLAAGIIDLMGVLWLQKRARPPLAIIEKEQNRDAA